MLGIYKDEGDYSFREGGEYTLGTNCLGFDLTTLTLNLLAQG